MNSDSTWTYAVPTMASRGVRGIDNSKIKKKSKRKKCSKRMEPREFKGIIHFLVMLYGKQSQMHFYCFGEPVCYCVAPWRPLQQIYSLSPSSV